MLKKTILASLLLAATATASAAQYYLVTPVKGKKVAAGAIQVGLSSSSLPGAQVGQAYTYDFGSHLQVTGDPGFTGAGVTWRLASGSLPSGIALNSTTGVLSGVPVATGTATAVVAASYKATVGQQSYEIRVTPALPVIAITDSTFGYNVKVDGNITAQTRAICDGKVSCSFRPQDLLVDPYQGIQKGLLVHYTCGSTPKTYQYGGPPEAGGVLHTLSCS